MVRKLEVLQLGNVQYALAYAKHGWSVFPCKGKIPLTTDGFKSATTNEVQIEMWWKKWPDANIGVATGKVSGITVLDIDDVEAFDMPLPTTVWSVTGGGGEHHFFQYDEKVKTCTGLFEGVDIRNDGGYVIVPPSKTEGDYYWKIKPSEMQMLFPMKYMYKEEKLVAEPLPDKIGQGQRDELLTSLAGSMRRRGASESAILEALKAENKRCEPPLSTQQLQKISQSVGKYEPADAPLPPINPNEEYWDWNTYVDEGIKVKSKMDSSKVCSYHIKYLDDALTGIAPSELVIIGADAGSGKTKLAMDIGFHNSSLGKRVALFALEGDKYEITHREMYRRICIELKAQGRPLLTYNQYIFNNAKGIKDVEAKVAEDLKKEHGGRLMVFARRNPLDKKSVIRHLDAIHDRVDMVIIDHLHYFEFLSGLEHSEITDIMKSVKMLTDKYRIPIVMVSHLRKKDKNRMFPDDDDFHGSSNIAKQSNTNIIISPVSLPDFPYEEQVATNRFSTGIRVSKARCGIQRKLVGVVDFDLDTRSYMEKYKLAQITPNGVEPLPDEYYPKWAKHEEKKEIEL